MWCASTVRCPIGAGENLRVVAAFSCSPKAALGACSHLLCAMSNLPKMRRAGFAGNVRSPAPHGVAEGSSESLEPAGGCMAFVVTKTRGPRGRRAGHQGRRNATKALGNSQGVIETCLWVRFGSLDCLDLAPLSLAVVAGGKRSQIGVPKTR